MIYSTNDVRIYFGIWFRKMIKQYFLISQVLFTIRFHGALTEKKDIVGSENIGVLYH